MRQFVDMASTASQETARSDGWPTVLSDAPFPRDLDMFLLMQAGFDREFADLPSPQREVFAHESARLRFEADVFWATEAIGTGDWHGGTPGVVERVSTLPRNDSTRDCGGAVA